MLLEATDERGELFVPRRTGSTHIQTFLTSLDGSDVTGDTTTDDDKILLIYGWRRETSVHEMPLTICDSKGGSNTPDEAE